MRSYWSVIIYAYKTTNQHSHYIFRSTRGRKKMACSSRSWERNIRGLVQSIRRSGHLFYRRRKVNRLHSAIYAKQTCRFVTVVSSTLKRTYHLPSMKTVRGFRFVNKFGCCFARKNYRFLFKITDFLRQNYRLHANRVGISANAGVSLNLIIIHCLFFFVLHAVLDH